MEIIQMITQISLISNNPCSFQIEIDFFCDLVGVFHNKTKKKQLIEKYVI